MVGSKTSSVYVPATSSPDIVFCMQQLITRYVSLKICLGTDAPELGNEAALLSELHPHLANFGVALPHLEQFSEDDIIDYFANPEIIPVVPRDTSFSMSSLPPYVTLRVSMADFLHMMKSFPAEPAMSIKILEFGRAHRTSEKLTTLPGAAPKLIRPPEVVVYDDSGGRAGSVWSKSADIWAVGCTVYQIYYKTSYEPISTWGSHNDFILRTLQLGGPPPDGWPGIWNTRSGHGNGMLHLRSWLL
ncbi:hypothetical protein MY4824_006101 [Beauveria thailandica]